ncbi:MAG: ATP-binding protein [Bacteroidota bacterium]
MTKRIVITGGPSTGKTSLINSLKSNGYHCFEEISRQVTLEARKQGIEQLFLSDPLLFSRKLLDGRTRQYNEAGNINKSLVFLDRGLPDVLAYMDFIGDTYPNDFISRCRKLKYDAVFILKPWLQIYSKDEERYESYEEAQKIHNHLEKTYQRFGYSLNYLPEDTVENRVSFLIDSLNL